MERSTRYRPPIRRASDEKKPAEKVMDRCPYLGADADPTTALAFPSEANHCHCRRVPAPISLIHQEVYCLGTQYNTCPVFRQSPEGIAAAATASASSATAVAATAVAATAVTATATVTNAELSAAARTLINDDLDLPEMIPLLAAATAIPEYQAPTENYDQPYIAAPSRFSLGRVAIIGLLVFGIAAAGWWAWQEFRSAPAADDVLTGSGQALPTLAAVASVPTTDPAALLGALPTVDSIWATPSPLPTPRPLQTPTPLAMPTDTSPQIMAVLGSPTPEPATITPTVEVAVVVESTATTEPTVEVVPTAVGPRVCTVPANWVPYVIQMGDTLSGIAVRHNTSISRLVEVNCLNDLVAYLGMTLYVPSLPGQLPALTAVATSPTSLPPNMGTNPTVAPQPTAVRPTSVPQPTQPPLPTATNSPARPTATPPAITSPTSPPPPPTATPGPTLPPTMTPPSP